MTGRIDITCSLPAPTLAQVQAWLTRTGWVEDPGHRGKRSTVWWHVSALHPHGGREGLRLTEGAIAKMIASAAHVLTRIRGTECTPDALPRDRGAHEGVACDPANVLAFFDAIDGVRFVAVENDWRQSHFWRLDLVAKVNS